MRLIAEEKIRELEDIAKEKREAQREKRILKNGQ